MRWASTTRPPLSFNFKSAFIPKRSVSASKLPLYIGGVVWETCNCLLRRFRLCTTEHQFSPLPPSPHLLHSYSPAVLGFSQNWLLSCILRIFAEAQNSLLNFLEYSLETIDSKSCSSVSSKTRRAGCGYRQYYLWRMHGDNRSHLLYWMKAMFLEKEGGDAVNLGSLIRKVVEFIQLLAAASK